MELPLLRLGTGKPAAQGALAITVFSVRAGCWQMPTCSHSLHHAGYTLLPFTSLLRLGIVGGVTNRKRSPWISSTPSGRTRSTVEIQTARLARMCLMTMVIRQEASIRLPWAKGRYR